MVFTRRMTWLPAAAMIVSLACALTARAAGKNAATTQPAAKAAPTTQPTKPRASQPTRTGPRRGPRSSARPTSMPSERDVLGLQGRPISRDEARQLFAKMRRIARLNRQLSTAFDAKQYDKCEPIIKRILDIDPNNATGWYNYACYRSRVGQADKAVECLAAAIRHGYSAYSYMQRDPDLEAVRKLPAYHKLDELIDQMQRKRADVVRKALEKQFGDGYAYEIDHERKLVFATNVDGQTLEEMKDRLTAYATAQWKDLFDGRFDRYLTIVIPKQTDWRWGATVGGFYSQRSNMLVARTVGLTLTHEFTHALHRADQRSRDQQHPIWITEGFATLFESSHLADGHAVPEINARLNSLQRLIRRKRDIPLADLVKFNQPKFMENPTASYGEVRYVMMYLYSKGLLRKWYDTYCDGYDADKTGRAALEKVFGKKLDAIEADWHKWVLAQKPALTRLPLDSAFIGIQLHQVTDGVEITGVLPSGGAARAGLKVGDVIVEVEGERIFEPAELMSVVHEHKPGDKVKVRYRRDGKYDEVTVTLTKMIPPRLLPRPRRPATSPATKPASTRPRPAQPATRPATNPAKRPPKHRSLPPVKKVDRKKAA